MYIKKNSSALRMKPVHPCDMYISFYLTTACSQSIFIVHHELQILQYIHSYPQHQST